MTGRILFYSGFAGITVFLGGVLANIFNHHVRESPVKQEITHLLISFGGIILSALALVLVPKGMEKLNLLPLSLSFLSGAILFFLIDKYLA